MRRRRWVGAMAELGPLASLEGRLCPCGDGHLCGDGRACVVVGSGNWPRRWKSRGVGDGGGGGGGGVLELWRRRPWRGGPWGAAVVAEASVVAEPMVVEAVAVGCAWLEDVVGCVSVLVAVSSSSCRVRRAARSAGACSGERGVISSLQS